MRANPLLQDVMRVLKTLGLQDIEVLREMYDPLHFGNAEVLIRVGRLLVRIQRDRGQDFVDLGSTASPDRFYQVDDVDIAMGWKSVAEVLAKKQPESLASVLGRLYQHLGPLEEAFSVEQECLTRARVERAAKQRRQELTDRLRR